MIQIVELFGGIGSPRIALRNLNIPTKSIDYVEIDLKAVNSYNAMFENELSYKTQNVIGWSLRPDILIHGSPCQDISIAGHQKGADEGTETRSSLMWETINIIKQMGAWKPRYVIWENVKNLNSKYMIQNFKKYLREMNRLGYKNSFDLLDAREFGLPQARKRWITISTLDTLAFDFNTLVKIKMQPLYKFLEESVDEKYIVDQPSILSGIGRKDEKRTTIITDYAYTITTRQDRTPAQVISLNNGKYRFLTERECWRLNGYSDSDYDKAEKANPLKKNVRFNRALYHQAGNSIPVPYFESIFRSILLGETVNKQILFT